MEATMKQPTKLKIKTLLKTLMLEEIEIYPEETEDYANSFYSRDLLTALGEVKKVKGASGKKRRFPPCHTSRKKKGWIRPYYG
jgi:hypothetical protein